MLKMMVAFFSDMIRFRKDLKKHNKWIEKFAAQKGYSVNPSWMFYTNLKIWMEETLRIFGKRYCPCFEPSGNDEIDIKLHCPCKHLDAELDRDGMCHCKLFGRGDLTRDEWEQGMTSLMDEYRVPLNLDGAILDTRGMHRDSLRNLPIPDAFHQVRQALQQIRGKELAVLVATDQERQNMERFALYRGLGFQAKKENDHYRITLTR